VLFLIASRAKATLWATDEYFGDAVECGTDAGVALALHVATATGDGDIEEGGDGRTSAAAKGDVILFAGWGEGIGLLRAAAKDVAKAERGDSWTTVERGGASMAPSWTFQRMRVSQPI
jgi:hypothetical protein